MEVIRHKLQRGFVIFYHKIGIFANDMDLLDLLLIEFIQLPIIFRLIFDFIVKNQAGYLHAVICDKKSALQYNRANFRKVQQCILNVFQPCGHCHCNKRRVLLKCLQ